MTSDKHADARTEIISIAARMVDGDMPLIEGARILCGLQHDIGASDSELFYPIKAFESETDDYPIGALQRQAHSGKWLVARDQEIARHLAEVRPEIHRACREIIAALQVEEP